MESLNNNTKWLNRITIEIDKFLVDCECINFFMQMYIQWIKYNYYTSSSQTLIIPRLPCFVKMALSQYQLYIEAQTMTQFFVCSNCKNTILIQAAEGKYIFFGILQMLRIYTALQKWSKRNVFYLHLRKRILLVSTNHALRLQRVNYSLNNIEWILIGKNMTLRFEMMMQ